MLDPPIRTPHIDDGRAFTYRAFLTTRSVPNAPATEFIRCRSFDGKREVEFVVEQSYDLDGGERTDLDPWE